MQRLQADWSVERAALTGGLAGLACSACRPTGRSKVPPRLQVDWSVQHTGVSRRAGLATVQRCWRTVQSCVHRLRGAWPVVRAVLAGGLVDRRAALAGGLVGRACSAYRRTGRSSVQRLHADWSVEPPRLQVDWPVQHTGACRRAGLAIVQRCRRTGQSCVHRLRRPGRSCVQRLQADWSIDRPALAGGLVGGACIACGRPGRSCVQRLQADWSMDRAALAGGLVG